MDTLNNIHELLHKTIEVRLKIPMSIFLERYNKIFQEQQKALENLKQDPTVVVIEGEEKIEVSSVDGIITESHYKIITITAKGNDKKCQTN